MMPDSLYANNRKRPYEDNGNESETAQARSEARQEEVMEQARIKTDRLARKELDKQKINQGKRVKHKIATGFCCLCKKKTVSTARSECMSCGHDKCLVCLRGRS